MPTLLEGENHFISLSEAKVMTARYMANKENILKTEYQDQNILSRCETFNREAFDTLLAETGCVGLRIYFGMNESLQVRTIIVGVNAENQDLLPEEVAKNGGGEFEIVEYGRPCPDFCPEVPL